MNTYRPIHRDTANLGTRIDRQTVRVLSGWLGRGESGGNNRGPWVSRITQGKTGAWCAALQYSAMEQACIDLGLPVPFIRTRRTYAARGLLKLYARHGRSVPIEEIRTGDYLCIARGRVAWQGHAMRISYADWPHALVIDGNVGSYERTRGAVRETYIDLREQDSVGAARLGP